MADMTLAIVITVLVVYALVLLLLHKFNVLQRLNMELVLGFMLMWRTEKGKKAINRWARFRRFWTYWGNLSLVLVIITSLATFILLLWEAVIVVSIPPELAPSPELLIGIPGINPLIPVGYGIVALAIAIVVHEFSHGILTRVARVRIRSLGVIAVIVPIGAFVEPDEEKLAKLSKKKRARVYAAGPMANLVMAFVCALIFSFGFMGTVEPVEDGMVIMGVTKDHPAEEAGLKPWMLITAVETANFTADRIVTNDDFNDVMARTKAGEVLHITYFYKGKTRQTQATLMDKYEYYKEIYPEPKYEDALEQFKGVGFLGIRTMSLRQDVVDAQARPFQRADTPLEMFGNGLSYVSLPIFKLSPMPDELSELIVINGPASFLGKEVFWVMANLFYWLFWLNFMVGATNALPAKPLDGGHIFADGMKKLLKRLRPGWKAKRIDKAAGRTSLAMSFLILFLIIWLVAGPWVAAGFRGLFGG